MRAETRQDLGSAPTVERSTPLSSAYLNVKREPIDYSLAEAIRLHSQACGLVAFVFNVHPDRVAEEVAALTRSESPTGAGATPLKDSGGGQ